MRFFVIDDDELSRELLSVLLGAEGHEVEVADSGEEALARLRPGLDDPAAHPVPNVILSDMQMPGISGASLAVALRQTVGERAKLLAMSGSQPAGSALAGFDGFLLKPISMAELDAVLKTNVQGFELSNAEVASDTGASLEAAQVPVLNEEIYAKLAAIIPGAQLDEVYGMCLADARKRLGQLAELAEAADNEGFRRVAHTVKGGCGMIGAIELYGIAEAAERDGLGSGPGLGLADGFGGLPLLLERFSRACDRLERILGERRHENSVPASGS